MSRKFNWDAIDPEVDSSWQPLLSGADTTDLAQVSDALSGLCLAVLQLRYAGADVWLNLSSSQSSGLPLATVRLAGKPRYAGGDTPAEFAAQAVALTQALQAALTA